MTFHSLYNLLVSQARALAQPFSDGSSGSGGINMSFLTPHICVPHSCAMCGHLCLGPGGEPIHPPMNTTDNEVHEMHDA